MILIPKGSGPEAIDALDDAVALWFSWRNENHFDAQVQEQSNDTAKNRFAGAKPCKGGIVIDLQEVGYAQGREGFQQTSESGGSGFIPPERLRQAARLQIDGVISHRLILASEGGVFIVVCA
jgi:hypothetical protein